MSAQEGAVVGAQEAWLGMAPGPAQRKHSRGCAASAVSLWLTRGPLPAEETTALSPAEGRSFPLSPEREAGLAQLPSFRTALQERTHGPQGMRGAMSAAVLHPANLGPEESGSVCNLTTGLMGSKLAGGKLHR